MDKGKGGGCPGPTRADNLLTTATNSAAIILRYTYVVYRLLLICV